MVQHMRFSSQSGRRHVAAFAFLTLAPLFAHLLYSAAGFNPAHDGAVLAAARRLLDGQAPHRDFICLHPALSPLLHVPILLLGGQHVLLLARLFAWFQLAAIAWAWAALTDRLLKGFFNLPGLMALAVLGLVFSAASFPAMAWHALNGLFLAALGLALCLCGRPALKIGGYFLCGCAVLCKPSFAVFAPVVLLTTDDWRRLKYWLAAALPGIAYLLFLASAGALSGAAAQMASWPVVRESLRATRFRLGMYIAAGYFGMRLIYGAPVFAPAQRLRWLHPGLGWAVICIAPLIPDFIALFAGALDDNTLNLFWALAGAGLYFGMETDGRRRVFGRLAGWAIALAWAAAVTHYRVSPAICGGILMASLAVMGLAIVNSAAVRAFVLAILAGAALLGFDNGRRLMAAREIPAGSPACPMDKLYPGARGIYAGANTRVFAADLQAAVALAGQWPRPYAIIPDCPGYWAASGQPNPLPFDSLREIEYYNPALADGAIEAMAALRPNVTILVQTADASRLGSTNYIQMLGRRRNRAAGAIRSGRAGFSKVGETLFFELYE